MSRKQPKRRAGNVVIKAIAGIFILAVVCGVGFGVASADSSDDLARSGGFGFDEETQLLTSRTYSQGGQSDDSEDSYYEQSTLAVESSRDVSASLKMLDEREAAEQARLAAEAEAERARIAAENAAALDRVAANQAKQGFPDNGLPAVDWSVGRDAFVAEWTMRIDAYLAGSALSGYGYAFAQAAWDNGVDPRWSPAISDTESGKGSVCFLPCNAWGWGESSWGDWETAIYGHVAGLAEGYGYSITAGGAAVYCPPNTAYWYSHTLEQMSWI